MYIHPTIYNRSDYLKIFKVATLGYVFTNNK